MNDIKITSKNQQGGITGQNVNAGSNDNFSIISPPKNEGKAKLVFWWVFGIIGAIAAIIAIIKFIL
jgi:hypothetical protein